MEYLDIMGRVSCGSTVYEVKGEILAWTKTVIGVIE